MLLLAALEAFGSTQLGSEFTRGQAVGDHWTIVGVRDPELGWRNRPGAHARIFGSLPEADGFLLDYEVSINSQGFRDPERRLEKRPGLRRVVLVGDSVSWGWGVDNHERFSWLLEDALGLDVEVINMAVPGYGTDQAFLTLHRYGWQYDPDLVLHCVVINDVLECNSAEYYGMPKPHFVRNAQGAWIVDRPAALLKVPGCKSSGRNWLSRLRNHSAFLRWATQTKRDAVENDFWEDLKFCQETQREHEIIQQLVAEIAREGSAVFHALSQMARACRDRSVPLIVFSWPYSHDRYLYEPLFPLQSEFDKSNFATPLTQAVDRMGKKLGIDVRDLDQELLIASRSGKRLHGGDGHPNQAAHALIVLHFKDWVASHLPGAERTDPVDRKGQ